MYGIELNEENAGPFFTHFCMALSRREKGEDIPPMSDDIFEEVEASDCYPSALFIAGGIYENIARFSAGEERYILLHLVNLVQKIREEFDRTVSING